MLWLSPFSGRGWAGGCLTLVPHWAEVSDYMVIQTLTLFSAPPPLVFPISASIEANQKQFLWAVPWHRHVSAFSFFPERHENQGISFQWLCCESRGWTMVREYHRFSYPFWYGSFHVCLGCRSLLIKELTKGISHKRNWSMYCHWAGISFGWRRVRLPILPSRW